MSRTSLSCLLALGFSISLAAACGDDADDGVIGGNGGNAGNAGNTGMSGNAGSGGGNNGGAAGNGMSGAGGDNGGAGGGDNGGASGDGGTGGDDAPDGGDGGPDAEPDSSTAGTGGAAGTGGTGGAGGSGTGGSATGGTGGSGPVADCPAVQNVVDANNNQDIGIVRVSFDGDGTVAIRNLATEIPGDAGATTQSLSSVFLCTSPEDCVDLGEEGDCDVFEIAVGEDAVCVVPDVLDPAGGELALFNALPTDPNAFIRAYLAWGTFISPDIPGGTTSFEDLATEGSEAVEFWEADDRIDAPEGTEDAFFADGDIGDADTWVVCTED